MMIYAILSPAAGALAASLCYIFSATTTWAYFYLYDLVNLLPSSSFYLYFFFLSLLSSSSSFLFNDFVITNSEISTLFK